MQNAGLSQTLFQTYTCAYHSTQLMCDRMNTERSVVSFGLVWMLYGIRINGVLDN